MRGGDGTIRLWDVAKRRIIKVLSDKLTGGVNSVAFSPDGKTLAAGFEDGIVRIWDLQRHTLLRSLGQRSYPSWGLPVAFSPDGKLLLSGDFEQGSLRIWDPASGTELFSIRANEANLTLLALSSDGKLLATADWSDLDGQVLLWEFVERRAAKPEQDTHATEP